MAVRIIRGAIGSGKDEYCIKNIEDVHNRYPDHKCIMLVPDHYSFETEKRFVEYFGGTGLNNIEVMTPRKMAINFLAKKDLKYLTPSGKRMLISRSVSEYCEEAEKTVLTQTMLRPGFIDTIASLISEMKRYCIMPEDLMRSAEMVDNKSLKEKLAATAEVYSKYNSFFAEGDYTDSDDDMHHVAQVICTDDSINETMHVWINRFDEFLPQHMEIISAFVQKNIDVTVGLHYPNTINEYMDETYMCVKNAYDKIKDLSDNAEEIVFDDMLTYVNSADIRYMLENRNNENAVYNEEPENIELFESLDSYSEVEHVAGEILRLVREKGLRFRDIAMINGSSDEFGHIIEAVFDEYGIPYFTDEKIMLSDHPIAMQIMSVFDMWSDNWSYDSVFRYLRAGFIFDDDYKRISQNKIDRLDNFVQKYNIRGRSKWIGEDWTEEKDTFEQSWGDEEESEEIENKALEIINDVRRTVTEPFKPLIEKVKYGKCAADYARALFEFLQDIHMYGGIRKDVTAFELKGQTNEAEQFSKIWNLIIEVLNQTVVTMGGRKMAFEEFGKYIYEGISQCEIRTIPSGIDRVYIGSVERSASAPVKAMFIAGAVNGTFPNEMTDEGFLSNADRNILTEECGIRLAPDTKRLMTAQYFKVYKAVASVTDMLFLSYHVQNSEGSALRPARMISDIKSMFPKMRISDNLISDSSDVSYISSPAATIHKLLINKSRNSDVKKSAKWDEVYRWFKKQGGYEDKLNLVRLAEEYNYRELAISPDMAKRLYERDINGKMGTEYSASRLNNYAKCPFMYFMKYGLRAKEKETIEIAANTVGTYAHRLIQEFCKTVEEGAVTAEEKLEKWQKLTDDDRDRRVGEITEHIRSNIRDMEVADGEKRIHIIGRIEKTVKNSIKTVHQSLKNGKYTTDGYEVPFEKEKIADGIFVRGAIDRLDVFEDENGEHIRIIDYKTGKLGSGAKKFNVSDIYDGLDMQPVIYALAVQHLKEIQDNVRVSLAGMYYNHISDDFAKSDSAEEAEEIHKAGYKMDGITFAERDGKSYKTDMIAAADVQAEQHINDKENYESEFIGIKLIKDGKIGSCSIHGTDERDALVKYVLKKIKQEDDEIKSGHIMPEPYQSSKMMACDYCAYKETCMFEEEKECRKKTFGGRDGEKKAWDKIKEQGGDE